jgi:hypothetical protein
MRSYAGIIAYSIVLALVCDYLDHILRRGSLILDAFLKFGTSFQVCLPGAVGEIFGPEALATNLGFISLFNLPASLFAAPIAGVIRDDTQSWKWMIVFAGACSLAGGMIATFGKSLSPQFPEKS